MTTSATEQTSEAAEEHIPTIDEILAAMDAAYEQLCATVQSLAPVLDAGPDAGGWTPRQALSHVIGAWQRVPVHTGFFLAGKPSVPIELHDSYWIHEWETAPLESFLAAMQMAHEGGKACVRGLDPASLMLRSESIFGNAPLGQLLMGSYVGHILHFHQPQLLAFVQTDEPSQHAE